MRKQTIVWKTKNGKKIRICDMSDQHLINAIVYIKRTAIAYMESAIRDAEWLLSFVTADMATYYAEQDMRSAYEASWDDYVSPLYWILELEAERRCNEKYEELAD
jgi:hypothetical protein